jgi:hypothetical protein
MESQTIRHMIEDDCADNGIPLPNVNSKILSKVIEYCNKHVHATAKAGADDTDANNSSASTHHHHLRRGPQELGRGLHQGRPGNPFRPHPGKAPTSYLFAHQGKVEILDLGLARVPMVQSDLDLFVLKSGYLCGDSCV